MKKTFILLVLGLLTLQVGLAAPRTLRQAKAIAERQAKALGIVVDQQSVQYSKAAPGTFSDQGAEAYYVFNNGDDRGFTIVSGDDLLPEIVGYSDRGTFTTENMPVQLKDFLDGYKKFVSDLLLGDDHAKKVAKESNSQLLTGSSPVHPPLLDNIAWGQGSPFNNMTPMGGGKHCLTGCVATAMGQIMAYYRYPSALMEDIPAYTTKKHGYEMPAISKGETYDWDNIINKYTEGNYNDEQAAAVAKLILHAGCAIEMDYDKSASSAVTSRVGLTLAKYFGYDPDNTKEVYRADVTQQEWNNLIYGELEAARPVVLSGKSAASGHAFICDGSDSNGLFHINWGWAGDFDGYFDITTLYKYQSDVTGGDDGYNRENYMICGIMPDNGIKDDLIHETPTVSGSYNSFNIDVSERADASGKFKITANVKVFNTAWEQFVGYIALKAKFANGEEKIVSDFYSVKIKARVEEGYYSKTLNIPVEYAFPEGVTAIEIVYSTDKTNVKTIGRWNWNSEHPVRYVSATATNLSSDSGIHITANLSTDATVYCGIENTFKLELTNSMQVEFLNMIHVITAYTDEMPAEPTFDIMATVPANGSLTRVINIKPTKTGTLHIWVSDSEGKIIAHNTFAVEPSTAPQLLLTSVTNNAKADVYETEKAYYKSQRVKAPKTDADHATFTYKVKNNGGTTYRTFYIKCISVESNLSYRNPYNLRIENGEEVTLEMTVKLSDMDSPFIKSYISLKDDGDGVELQIDDNLSQPRLYFLDDEGKTTGRYYYFNKNYSFIYLDTSSSDVNPVVDNNNKISGGEGVIYITSDKKARLNVVNLGGQIIRTVSVEAGVTATVAVSPGIYVVDGVKVVVR